jgi:hypothetical protein
MFGATNVLWAHTRAPKSPMRFLVAVALMALIASPSVAADRDAERIVTRQVASIVPPDGAGDVAVALRIEGRSRRLSGIGHDYCQSNSVRIASSLRADMIFRKDTS